MTVLTVAQVACDIRDFFLGHFLIVVLSNSIKDRLCGLVVRVSGQRYRGLGFDPRRYQIF
jgi:hypothetical protein